MKTFWTDDEEELVASYSYDMSTQINQMFFMIFFITFFIANVIAFIIMSNSRREVVKKSKFGVKSKETLAWPMLKEIRKAYEQLRAERLWKKRVAEGGSNIKKYKKPKGLFNGVAIKNAKVLSILDKVVEKINIARRTTATAAAGDWNADGAGKATAGANNLQRLQPCPKLE